MYLKENISSFYFLKKSGTINDIIFIFEENIFLKY